MSDIVEAVRATAGLDPEAAWVLIISVSRAVLADMSAFDLEEVIAEGSTFLAMLPLDRPAYPDDYDDGGPPYYDDVLEPETTSEWRASRAEKRREQRDKTEAKARRREAA